MARRCLNVDEGRMFDVKEVKWCLCLCGNEFDLCYVREKERERKEFKKEIHLLEYLRSTGSPY